MRHSLRKPLATRSPNTNNQASLTPGKHAGTLDKHASPRRSILSSAVAGTPADLHDHDEDAVLSSKLAQGAIALAVWVAEAANIRPPPVATTLDAGDAVPAISPDTITAGLDALTSAGGSPIGAALLAKRAAHHARRQKIVSLSTATEEEATTMASSPLGAALLRRKVESQTRRTTLIERAGSIAMRLADEASWDDMERAHNSVIDADDDEEEDHDDNDSAAFVTRALARVGVAFDGPVDYGLLEPPRAVDRTKLLRLRLLPVPSTFGAAAGGGAVRLVQLRLDLAVTSAVGMRREEWLEDNDAINEADETPMGGELALEIGSVLASSELDSELADELGAFEIATSALRTAQASLDASVEELKLAEVIAAAARRDGWLEDAELAASELQTCAMEVEAAAEEEKAAAEELELAREQLVSAAVARGLDMTKFDRFDPACDSDGEEEEEDDDDEAEEGGGWVTVDERELGVAERQAAAEAAMATEAAATEGASAMGCEGGNEETTAELLATLGQLIREAREECEAAAVPATYLY